MLVYFVAFQFGCFSCQCEKPTIQGPNCEGKTRHFDGSGNAWFPVPENCDNMHFSFEFKTVRALLFLSSYLYFVLSVLLVHYVKKYGCCTVSEFGILIVVAVGPPFALSFTKPRFYHV